MTPQLNSVLDTSKAFNVKNLITIVVIVLLVGWAIQKIGTSTIILYGPDGKETGRGKVQWSLKSFAKKS